MISKSNKYLKMLALTLISFIFIYYMLQDLIFENDGDNFKYVGLIPITILYFVAILLVNFKSNLKQKNIAVPSVLFLLFMAYYIYLGSIDHYLQNLFGSPFTYNESIDRAYNYIMLSLVCWILGYVLGNILKLNTFGNKSKEVKVLVIRRWDRKRFKILVYLFGVLGLISFSVFYLFYVKGFPALQGVSPSVSSELRSIVNNEGHLAHLLAFTSMTMVLIFGSIYIVLFAREKLMMSLLILAIIAFLLWGARIYIAIPFLMVFPYLARLYNYSIKKVLVVLLSIMILGSIYGTVRNLAFYEEKNQDLTSTKLTDKLASLHISPEFRDTLGVISHLDTLQQLYGPGPYISGIILNAAPGKFFDLIGFNKKELFDDEGTGSGWLIAQVTRGYDWVGIRSGIMGQTLMAFGVSGVAILFILYGVLFSYLDRASFSKDTLSPSTVLIYILSGLFSFSIIGTTHSVFSKFWYLMYIFIIFYIFATRKKVIRYLEPSH